MLPTPKNTPKNLADLSVLYILLGDVCSLYSEHHCYPNFDKDKDSSVFSVL